MGVGLFYPVALRAEDVWLTALIAEAAKGAQKPLTGLIPDGSQSNMEAVARRWKDLTGQDVVFETTEVDDINSRLMADAIVGQTKYDFALPATFGLADLVYTDALHCIEDIAVDFRVADPGEGDLYSFGDIVDGRRYGFQTDGDVYMSFYRKDFLEDERSREAFEARFGYPLAVAASWSQLDAQIEFFHDPASGRFGGALFRNPGYLAWEFLTRVSDKGQRLFSDDFEPNISGDHAVEALEQLIRVTDFLHPDAMSAGLFKNWELYRSNDIFANIGWGGGQKAFNHPSSPIRGKLAFGTVPFGASGNRGYFNWGWSYVVPRGASQPELAALFSRYAVTDSVSTEAVRAVDGYFDPFRVSHYADPVIRDVYSPEFLAVHERAMRDATVNLYVPGYSNYMGKLNENLSLALTGKLSPKSVLELTESEWRLVTLELGAKEQAQRWKAVLALQSG